MVNSIGKQPNSIGIKKNERVLRNHVGPEHLVCHTAVLVSRNVI